MSHFSSDQQPPAADEDLLAAYLATEYRFQEHTLKIGHRHPEFDRWLATYGFTKYAFITPYNPLSRPLSAWVNAQRLRQFVGVLQANGLSFGPADATDPAGEWPTEQGVFVFDLPAGRVHALGRSFQQYAVVEGRIGGVPLLVWL